MLIALLVGCGGPADGDTADTSGQTAVFDAPDAPGAYGVSATTLTWTDDRGQDMVAEVWYPIAPEDGCDAEPYPEVRIVGQACRDVAPAAPPAGGFPLIAFSHGNAGIRYQSIFLTEALAQHGYVVVAPDHPGNTLLDFDEAAIGTVAERRPADVRSAVDRLIALSTPPLSEGGSPSLAGLVQTDRYGMAGHSFGGWTTLAVAGGVVDLDGLRTFCADRANAHVGYDFCRVLEALPENATSADFAPPDARAVTGFSMAPAGWYSFAPGAVDAPGGLDTVAPTLVLGGTLDESESVENEIQPLYDRLTGPTSRFGPDDLGILTGAGHYAFTDICLIGDLQPDCDEAAGGYIELDTAHAIIERLGLAWFGLTLREDARYQTYLDDASEVWSELSWEAGE